jgi:hypothetical protein
MRQQNWVRREHEKTSQETLKTLSLFLILSVNIKITEEIK